MLADKFHSWQPIVAKTEVQDEGTSALAVQQNDGRACLIMSPRLGQKSYGGEKRSVHVFSNIGIVSYNE